MASLSAGQAESAWQGLRSFGVQTIDSDGLTLRAALLPSQVAPFLESVESAARGHDLSFGIDARPALGTVYCQIAGDEQSPRACPRIARRGATRSAAVLSSRHAQLR